jgi:hypothetical protein
MVEVVLCWLGFTWPRQSKTFEQLQIGAVNVLARLIQRCDQAIKPVIVSHKRVVDVSHDEAT